MSKMYVYGAGETSDPRVVTERSAIASELGAMGIEFEQWECDAPLGPDADEATILAAYGESVSRVKSRGGFTTADVIGLTPDHPDKGALREKFLSEHIHSEDEVRFFIEGSGLFYLHLGEVVVGIECTQGDYLSVPANTRHWFDMGPDPAFRCIRFFTNPEGWVAKYTGDEIASNYPRYDSLEGGLAR